jgi:hypothetical protein
MSQIQLAALPRDLGGMPASCLSIPGPSRYQAAVQAALANLDIQSYLSDPSRFRLWTVEGVDRHPTVRVVYEHAEIIGGLGESLAAARHKSFGQFLAVEPLRPNDPVHPSRILFVYKASSPYNRRDEQRRALKRLLDKQHRSPVTRAARSTKRDSLKHDLTTDGAKAIYRRLKLDPGRFWRVAEGKEFLDLPQPPVQLLLFDDLSS